MHWFEAWLQGIACPTPARPQRGGLCEFRLASGSFNVRHVFLGSVVQVKSDAIDVSAAYIRSTYCQSQRPACIRAGASDAVL